jgi:hypothetical protein
MVEPVIAEKSTGLGGLADKFADFSQCLEMTVKIFDPVTGHRLQCRSVELIQCVTVTGLCRIDRNGTVIH